MRAAGKTNFNKTLLELEMCFDVEEQKENEAKYLSYVDELHSRMNSKSFHGPEPVENESESEIYSQHRLRSSSSEKASTLRLEETQGKLYVVKKIDDLKTVKIPQLDLDNIIEKQKRKMYPFNINTQGELVEISNRESSMDTHNDEDAIIIYDEQDQEDDFGSFNELDNKNKQPSNLFNSSLFSDLSSVHKSIQKQEAEFKGEKDYEDFKHEDESNGNTMIIVDDKKDYSTHNSFLDQELNIESIHNDNNEESKNVSFIQ